MPKPPDWLGFVRDGFGTDIHVPDRTSTPAVIAVRVRYYVDRYFALTLGGGHFKLDRTAIARGYGLRVALNAIYEDDDTATGRTLLDLPFFSKVNLVRSARELRTLGFRVTYKPITIA